MTVWISDEALSQWSAPRRTSRGGQPKYSDLAITMYLTLRVVYDEPLRQAQGIMRIIAKLMGVEIAGADFSTLSRRGKGLVLSSKRPATRPSGPVHLVVDSTVLKVFGDGEWIEKNKKSKSNARDGASFTLVSILSVEKSSARNRPRILSVPPQPCLIFSIRGKQDQWPDAWQKSTGYNQRSRIETQMGRWKTVIRTKLKARNFDNQTTEAKIGVRALNQITILGRPEFRCVT
ncbi:transposase [Allorhizobium ampelinum]|uniref:transposase n=1 Tax=Allorhizobium ampelinum TaxID=3025782 RepID=UPI001F293C00|nr:transposase [Allorhizobium ampelinum]